MNGQKFSLSFSKRIETKSLQPSALGSEGRAEVKRSPQALLAVDHDSLKVNENAEEEELVIPLLQAKRSAVLSRLAKLQQEDGTKESEGKKEEESTQENQEDSKPLTLEERAERALLEESKRRLDEWSTRDVKDITIPAEDPLAAPLTDIGKESTLDDYDEIAVESFGAAILRGMGWKKSEGIGGREKKVIDIIDPSTKTLGSSEGKQGTAQEREREEEREDEEELPIVKGAYVFLHSGRHRGTYGVVEVVDEDHLLIRAAVGQAVLREVQGNLRVATQKEYRESSRVINKEMYDKFKEAEMKKNEAKKKMHYEEDKEGGGSDRDRKSSQKTNSKDREEAHRRTDSESVKVKQESSEEDKNRKQRERESEKERDKNRRERDETEEKPRENSKKQSEGDNERCRDRNDERQRQHREKEAEEQRYKGRKQEYGRDERKNKSHDHKESDRKTQDPQARLHKDTQASGGKKRQEQFTEAQEMKAKQQRMVAPPWVRENLRVRIINKNYKGGKYHKQKVVVVSVVTAESCECVVDGGRLLGGVDPAWLETVIPKQPPMVVMVVRGRHNGLKGRILQLHKDQEKASIQLLEDETTILKLHYDDICEYVTR